MGHACKGAARHWSLPTCVNWWTPCRTSCDPERDSRLRIIGPALLKSLEVALGQNKWLAEILERFEEIALPDCWLAAGSIAQTIWNLSCGQPAELGLKDVDLIYFDDRDLSFETEAGS